MKQYRNLPELLEAPRGIRRYLAQIARQSKQPFEELFGGDVFEIEEKEDLKQITLDYFEETTLFENTGQFENAVVLNEWVALHTPTTDAGGPVYFIPNAMVTERPNIVETLANSNAKRIKL